ncbi:MAG: hypothetical protein ACK55D_08735, partial [Synechococcaceae cyanobacterium]
MSSKGNFASSGGITLAADQYFTFTYYYGNRESYSGYGYAESKTYKPGQELVWGSNELGEKGHYVINTVEELGFETSQVGYIYVNQYIDAVTDSDGVGSGGYGTAHYGYGYGYSGLGSESGYAYNSSYTNADSYFSNYYSADLIQPSDQLFSFTYYYGNGDFYSGYGYAAANTYISGQSFSGPYNETYNYGKYYISSVTDLGYESYSDGYITVDTYYDAATDYDGVGVGGYGTAHYGYGYGYSGLGSESGFAYNSSYTNADSYFSNYYSADLIQPSDQFFYFTYYYGNGDSYNGYGYAAANTYSSGQWLTGTYNETYNYGSYFISSVVDLGYESYADGYISVYEYYDGATDYDGIGVGGYGTAH